MESFYQAEPEEIARAKRTYWIAYAIAVVVLMAVFILSLVLRGGEHLHLFSQYPQVQKFLSHFNPSGMFTSMAAVAAVAVCRRFGVSLEARFKEKYQPRRIPVANGELPTTLQYQKSMWWAGIVFSGLFALLFATGHILTPVHPWAGMDLLTFPFAFTGIWSIFQLLFADTFVASVDSTGIQLRNSSPLLPGRARRRTVLWSEVGDMEILRERNALGADAGGKVSFQEGSKHTMRHLAIGVATPESREQFLKRLREEALVENIPTASVEESVSQTYSYPSAQTPTTITVGQR